MRWGIDISRYDDTLTDANWQMMADNGLSFAIIRACHGVGYTDPLLSRHVGQANKYGIPFGLYQWVDITHNVQDQANYFLRLIESYRPKCAAGDFEQYWTDWAAWNKARLGGGGVVPVMPPEQINAINYAYFTQMRSALSIPLVSYTGAWFVNRYCPQMAAWLGQSYLWLAGYIATPPAAVGWDEFQRIVGNLGSPIFPTGINRWDIWQFSASLPITGLPQLDLDAIVSEQGFKNLFVIPKIYEPVGGSTGKARVIASNGLRVRAAPNLQAQILRGLLYGTIVEIVEIQEGWARLADGGWCVAQWLQLLSEPPPTPPADTTPPAAITNLTAAAGTATGSIDLAWTAPGDDANSGTANRYLVRYATRAIGDQPAWEAATPVSSGLPAPKPAGGAERMTVSGLTPGTMYYFAVRAQDEASNLSGLSNSPWAIAMAPPPQTLPRNAKVIAGLGLRVRAAPNLQAEILRGLPFGTLVQVVEIQEGWARLADSGWCAAQWLQFVAEPPPTPPADTTPPAAITNLTAVAGTATGSIDLAWTAPGDDANSGTASLYLLRYATRSLGDQAAWEAATPVSSGLPAPKPAGGAERMTVSGLTPGTMYYFAVRAQDEASNLSGLSNSPSAIATAPPTPPADTTPPAAITNLTAAAGTATGSIDLAWTAPGDDANSGTANRYLVRYATRTIGDQAAWEAATPVSSGLPAPKPAGGAERMTVSGLTPGTRYYFAVRAQDEASNLSGLSNSPSAIATAPPPQGLPRNAKVIAGLGLRVRAAPDPQAQILRALPFGAQVVVVEMREGWARLSDGGWCAAQWLELLTEIPETPSPAPELPKKARVTVKIGLRVRAAPDLQAQILRALPFDTIVEVVEVKDGWARLAEGGWCAAQWLEMIA